MSRLLQVAMGEWGVTEIKGPTRHNKRILQYSHDLGQKWVRDDETSWCSLFLSWCALKAGYQYNLKKPATARGWLDAGDPIQVPQVGDVVVFWRIKKSHWAGHVGLFIRDEGSSILLLGGNQGSKVKIAPYAKSRLLGYIRPIFPKY